MSEQHEHIIHPSGGVSLFDPLEHYNATPFTPDSYTPSHNIREQHGFPRFGHTNDFDQLVRGVTAQSGSGEGEARDYIVGVVAGAMLIFGFALVWFMAIVCLKVAGRKKVGFLAGDLIHPAFEDAEAAAASKSAAARDIGALPVIEEEPPGADEATAEEEIESLMGSSASGGAIPARSALETPLIISNGIDSDAEAAKRVRSFDRRVLAVRLTFATSGLLVLVAGILFYTKGVVLFADSLNTFGDGLQVRASLNAL